MLQPKFIITQEGYLRLGLADRHADLLHAGDTCLGGGLYEIDYTAMRLVLEHKSYDYGRPQWNRLDRLLVPEAYRGMRIVYHYDDDTRFDVSGNLRVGYI